VALAVEILSEGRSNYLVRVRPDHKRVVITGMGAISPLGLNVQDSWQGMVDGRSGVDYIIGFDASHFPTTFAAQVRDFDPTQYMSRKEARRIARVTQLSIATSMQAMADAGLERFPESGSQNGLAQRSGALLGTSYGGFSAAEYAIRDYHERGLGRVNPFALAASLPNMVTSHVCLLYNIQGYTSTICTACASGTQAIGEAAEVIRRGNIDLVLAGGMEAMVTEVVLAGFSAMRALSSRNDDPAGASRPFDAERDGFVIGEGCAIFVLEQLPHAVERGAHIYAEVLGYGVSADTYHIAQPDPQGRYAELAMRRALENSGATVNEVDYINAHGTATPLGDAAETVAIKRLFGERAYEIPISSTKSMIGHALGGAGAIEALACIQSIRTGIIHPTINYQTPDPDCDLDYVPNVARQSPVRVALSNSFGLGGQNACLVLGRFEV
jgi:3-oxoacyl-[acyl-carrier-protein] synthase II